MKQLLIKIWHYTPMLLILIMSTATYMSVQTYLGSSSKNLSIETAKHEPLYKMYKAEFHNLDLDKKSNYTIFADEAIQYIDDNSFLLNTIKISNKDSKQLSIITALSGVIDKEFNTIDFNQAFVQNHSAKGNIIINSDKMIFYPKLDKVETKSRTIIQQNQNNVSNLLEADTVIFNNITRNIDLQGKVFGILRAKNKG